MRSLNKIGVIGLDYVGLPKAVVFASKGYKVVCVDVDARRLTL
jgi:UDP-N-acetyl-D-mannosaminuronic acid dehydrogenase